MGYVLSAIPMMVWVFVIFMIIIVSARKKGLVQKGRHNRNTSYAPVKNLYTQVAGRSANPVQAKKTVSGEGMILKDDKTNDWLAKQLREESKAVAVLSDMFQLKSEHRNACDAEFIKRFHESNCDAYGVDDGTRKH